MTIPSFPLKSCNVKQLLCCVNFVVSARLTTEELLGGDTLVFEKARELGLPVTWCLAGGYQRDENGGISTTHLHAVLLQQPDHDPSFIQFCQGSIASK